MTRRAKHIQAKPNKGVEAVDRAISILLSFSESRPSLTLTELAEHTGYYKSTILRIAASLEKPGFLIRDKDKSYRLGPRLMNLGVVYQKALRLDITVRPILQELLAATGESASFFRRDNDYRICLFREESGHSVRDHIHEGDVLPLDRGAAGRVLVEFSGLLPHTQELRLALLDMPRVSFGERDSAAAGLAVPVFSVKEGLAGALSLSGPISRFTDERLPLMAYALRHAGKKLSVILGGGTYWDDAT